MSGELRRLWRWSLPSLGLGIIQKKSSPKNWLRCLPCISCSSWECSTTPKKLLPESRDQSEVTLSDSTIVGYEQARNFMDYYCRRYGFGKPEIAFNEIRKSNTGWEAVMTVGGRRIGLGSGSNKKAAQVTCFLDVTQYLESCDAELWKSFVVASKSGADLGMAPKVYFQMSDGLDDAIRDLCVDIKRSSLYRNRPALKPKTDEAQTRIFGRKVGSVIGAETGVSFKSKNGENASFSDVTTRFLQSRGCSVPHQGARCHHLHGSYWIRKNDANTTNDFGRVYSTRKGCAL